MAVHKAIEGQKVRTPTKQSTTAQKPKRMQNKGISEVDKLKRNTEISRKGWKMKLKRKSTRTISRCLFCKRECCIDIQTGIPCPNSYLDTCVICGKYVAEGTQICEACKKKAVNVTEYRVNEIITKRKKALEWQKVILRLK